MNFEKAKPWKSCALENIGKTNRELRNVPEYTTDTTRARHD